MSSIYHPNVVLFMGAATRPTIKIVTELCVTDVEKVIRVRLLVTSCALY